MCNVNSTRMGRPWPKTEETHYHSELGLPDKNCARKGLNFCNSRVFSTSGPAKCLANFFYRTFVVVSRLNCDIFWLPICIRKK